MYVRGARFENLYNGRYYQTAMYFYFSLRRSQQKIKKKISLLHINGHVQCNRRVARCYAENIYIDDKRG